ncbi:hypothetical protein [Hyunsoonleella pacifica]|nr:hypothetical protein [Hyunsoonleella pacifica]
MAKIYSENSLENTKNLKPKDETVKFLLNYSKALKVKNGKYGKYEMLLN